MPCWTWCRYLDTDVTVRDITDDVRPVGGHNPAGGMSSSAENGGSESEFRMTAIVQYAIPSFLPSFYCSRLCVVFSLSPFA